ncbi:MAG: diguanylate cyclase [Gloeocapsa sp. DLM2.Bin57]|nr:MAG: diguanylate cyclase [Gloeocapsa sp. DLM2.Bin57]
MNKDVSETILIVDDQIANLKVLATMLEKEGYQVRKAIDGETALIAIENYIPNLILLDIKMPDLDGYEVCQRIKNNPQTQSIPIIFISALNEVFDKVKAFEVGGIDYINKPFQEEEVLVRIKSQLTIQQQQKLLRKEIQYRQETEAILYQSRALIASILNASTDGIAALQAVRNNRTGDIVDFSCIVVNPVIAATFNREPDELLGKLVIKMFLNKFKHNLFADFVKVVETGKPLEKDICLTNQEEVEWYHLIVVKLGDGVAITARNITERKNLEFKLNYLANIDGLTGIANRRNFDQTLQKKWECCQRNQQPLSLILADIDYFKGYNDRYGHIAGDDCLKKVAQIISSCIRESLDLVARFGGEEFGIILANLDQDGVITLVKSLQDQVNLAAIPHEKSPINPTLSLSFGIVTCIPTSQHQPLELIKLADQSLYYAKEKGRNQYVIATNFNSE